MKGKLRETQGFWREAMEGESLKTPKEGHEHGCTANECYEHTTYPNIYKTLSQPTYQAFSKRFVHTVPIWVSKPRRIHCMRP